MQSAPHTGRTITIEFTVHLHLQQLGNVDKLDVLVLHELKEAPTKRINICEGTANFELLPRSLSVDLNVYILSSTIEVAK